MFKNLKSKVQIFLGYPIKRRVDYYDHKPYKIKVKFINCWCCGKTVFNQHVIRHHYWSFPGLFESGGPRFFRPTYCIDCFKKNHASLMSHFWGWYEDIEKIPYLGKDPKTKEIIYEREKA